MTRAKHLQWCKDRAMEYVNRGQLTEAVTSMMSDITKHPETNSPALAMLGLMAAMDAQAGNRDSVVRYITGFN